MRALWRQQGGDDDDSMSGMADTPTDGSKGRDSETPSDMDVSSAAQVSNDPATVFYIFRTAITVIIV